VCRLVVWVWELVLWWWGRASMAVGRQRSWVCLLRYSEWRTVRGISERAIGGMIVVA
jgi:hypothetical protein